MSIGGNLGMAMIINDLGASVTANSAGAANIGSAGLVGESPFQKLISQTLANSGIDLISAGTMTETAAASEDGVSKQTGGIGSLLAALLFGNANQAKLKLQVSGNDSESKKFNGLLQDDSTSELDEAAEATLESIQAMFGGMFTRIAEADRSNENAGLSNGILNAVTHVVTNAVARAILADPVRAAGSGPNGINGLVNQNNDPGSLEILVSQNPLTDSVLEMTQMADFNGKITSAAANGNPPGLTGIAKGIEAAVMTGTKGSPVETGNAESPVQSIPEMKNAVKTGEVAEIGRFGQIDSGLEVLNTDMRERTAQPGFKIFETVCSVEFKAGETEPDAVDVSLKAAAYQSQLHSKGTADAAAANQPGQPVETPEAYSQISDKILTMLERKGPTEFKMQLEPEDLGQIDIKLKLSEGKLIIDILAANSKTQALLISQTDKLVSAMGLQNVQVENVQVIHQMNSQTQDNSQNQGNAMNSTMDFSQRKQQEQYRQEFFGGTKPNVTFGLQQDETITNNQMNRIESTRYDFHKMNYTV